MAEKKKKVFAAKLKNNLTAQESKFIDEYMIDMNGSEAVMRSFKSYKKSSSFTKANDLLNKPHIKEELERRVKERSEKANITAEMVLRELAAIAFFDVRKIFDKKNNLKNIAELDDNAGRAISAINIEVDALGNNTFSTTKKIKLNDKLRALQLVGNHIGMFKESTSGAEDIASAIKELARNLPD